MLKQRDQIEIRFNPIGLRSLSRENCSVRQINMTISLASLAPNLGKAAIEGRLPRGIGVERLRDLPSEWSRQLEALGLNPE
jgi:site-specific DNA recombinase